MLVCVWTGLPALDLWDVVIEVLGMTHRIPKPTQACTGETSVEIQSTHKIKQVLDQNVDLSNMDQAPSNAHLSEKESQLYISEDNEAVIKMIIKGRSPTMRHVSRTHRGALDWSFDRINLDAKIKHVESKNQLANILTEGSFTRNEWHHLLCLFNISHFSLTNCSEVMSKRTQKVAGEERVTAKSKPMVNLVSRCSERNPDVLASIASESPGKTRFESQIPLSSWTEQHLRTVRLVKDACPSSYSECNAGSHFSKSHSFPSARK